jgi:hypothetical protein
VGGGAFFEKGPFLWDNILEGDSNGRRPHVWPTYHTWIGGSGDILPQKSFEI